MKVVTFRCANDGVPDRQPLDVQRDESTDWRREQLS